MDTAPAFPTGLRLCPDGMSQPFPLLGSYWPPRDGLPCPAHLAPGGSQLADDCNGDERHRKCAKFDYDRDV